MVLRVHFLEFYQYNAKTEKTEGIRSQLLNLSIRNKINILFFLPEITSEAIRDCMERFSNSSNTRLSNLAKVFLQVLYSAMHHSSETSSVPF